MENPDQFFASSRSIIRQARRDRLKYHSSSIKLLKLILIVLIVVPLFLWVNSKVKLPETAAGLSVTTAPAVAADASASLEPLNLSFVEGASDWNTTVIAVGHAYQIPAEQQELWNKIFNDPNNTEHPTIDNVNRLAAQSATENMPSEIIVQRILESTQTGVLNLIN